MKCPKCGYENEGDAAFCNLCQEVLRKKPKPAQGGEELARLAEEALALESQGRFEEALSQWDRLIALRPGEGRWLDKKAKALYALGRKEEAVGLSMKALEDPAFAKEFDEEKERLMGMLGIPKLPLTPEQERQTLEALASHDMSLAPEPVREQGEQLERQFKALQTPVPERARELARTAQSSLDPSDAASNARALTAAEEALGLAPDYPLALFFRAAALHFLGRACAAAAAYTLFLEKAWADNPKLVEAAKEALMEFRGAGVPAAPPEPARASRIDEAYAKFADEKLFASKRYAEALGLCDATLALHPGHPNAWFIRGRGVGGLEGGTEALPCFLEAGRLLPEFANAWIFAARLLLKTGKPEEALRAADGGLSHAAGSIQLRALRINALLLCGKEEEGMRALDSLLADPALPPELRAQLSLARRPGRPG